MATITTRAGKGAPLTNAELDANFSNLNTELGQKLTSAALVPYLTISAANAAFQPLDPDLSAIAGLTGTTGLLRKTAADTWTLDTTAYISGITSGMVTTALGFTPYSATNPAGYITSAALAPYLTSSTAASTYLPLAGGTLTGGLAGTTLSLSGAASIQGITVGRGAGAVATNTAVGASALLANTSGTQNTAVGLSALQFNTTGTANSAFGLFALRSNTTGSNNTAVGQESLWQNTTALNNTAVGYQAGYATSASGANVFVGHTAGRAAVTTGSVLIGVEAGYNSAGNYNTAVGWNAFAWNTANSSGAANAAFGAESLKNNITGDNNTAIGTASLRYNSTGSNNTALGYQAGYVTTAGGMNTAVGAQALLSNTTFTENTAVGASALRSANAGIYQTALGAYAGYSVTTGTGNTFVGAATGYSATTGSFNTLIGVSQGFFGAGHHITTGSKNTIIGGFNGNQGGLDIRTSNNNIVLSDGDGNPVIAASTQTEVLMRSGSGLWTLFSNGGGNSTTYNGTLIGANKGSLAGQANAALPSWFIDIGGRAGDGTTRPTSTQDKFSVGRQAPGGTLYGAANVFEVNQNGCVGLNTASASSGTGITFPATQNASADPNTLDDYEEGSFTPVLTFGGGNTGMSGTFAGSYVKVGCQVTIRAYIALTNKGTSTGSANITGLPFHIAAVGAVRYAPGSIYIQGGSITLAAGDIVQINLNDSTINLNYVSATSGVDGGLSHANFGAGAAAVAFWISATYTTDN